jgi:hypothetical protein
MMAVPERLAKRMSACALARTWVTVPGSGFDQVRPHGLDRIDDDQTRRFAFAKRRHDVLDRGLGGKLDLSARKAEPLGAKPHLRHRLFAGNIDRALLGAGQRRCHLDQQRRFADPGIAAEEQHGAAHEAAAGDAVELGDPRGEPGASWVAPASASSANARPLRGARPGICGRALAAFSSAMVFHSPQASHLPCQRP